MLRVKRSCILIEMIITEGMCFKLADSVGMSTIANLLIVKLHPSISRL